MEKTQNLSSAELKNKALEKLKSLGFKKEKQLGMKILNHTEGETLILQINSDIQNFVSKTRVKDDGSPEEYQFVTVDNLETGETDLTYWLSGQLRYMLQNQDDGFIGGKFAITHLGQVKIDGQRINQFDVLAIKEE